MTTKIIAVAVLATALGLSQALAQEAHGKRISLTRAVAIAEQATGGHVLDAELEERNGRLFYEVDLLQGKKLQQLTLDARDGKIVERSAPLIEGYWTRWFESDRLGRVTSARRLSELLTRLERQTGGEVVEASFDVEEGQPRYEVEIATRAGVADVNLDPRTGERLSMVLDD